MNRHLHDIRTKHLPGIGRSELLGDALRLLEQGDHVSIVAPRYMGKTCFLRALLAQAAIRQHFIGVTRCDLRANVPVNNAAFFAQMLSGLYNDPGISPDWKDFAVVDPGGSAWETLFSLAKGLAAEDLRMLIVLDGIDDLSSQSQVNADAWNPMNTLVDTGGIQFVISSRDQLEEILLDSESTTSNFFQRFTLIRLGPVTEHELTEWLSVMPAGEAGFDKGAQTELLNETGGHPRLLAALLSELDEATSAEAVRTRAKALVQGLPPELKAVFRELSQESQTTLATLQTAGNISKSTRRELMQRGFIRPANGDKVTIACRMMATLAEDSLPGETTMRELFGCQDAYFSNIPHTLKWRLVDISSNRGHTVFRHAEKMVKNLDSPGFAISGATRLIEDEIVKVVEKLIGAPFPKLNITSPPRGFQWRGERYRADNARIIDGLSRAEACPQDALLPRSVGVLFNSLHSIGNYVAHLPEGENVSPGVAHSMATLIVELISELVATPELARILR